MNRNHHKPAWFLPKQYSAVLALLCLIAVSVGAIEHTELFEGHPVWEIKLTISEENIERLRKEPREDVSARIEVLGKVYENVAVHLKGTGTFQPIDQKPSFTVNFSKLSPGREIGGTTKIHLNNSLQDAAFLREQLGSELMRQAGIPAPRVSRAKVELNGEKLGFYVVKEGFTRGFLERTIGKSGTFLEPAKGRDIDKPMDVKWDKDDRVPAELNELVAAAAETDAEKRWLKLNELLDVEKFASLIAAEVMICHWDGYGLGPNNYRLYLDRSVGKFVFLPAGMDQIFGKADLPLTTPMSGLVARAFMNTANGRQLFRRRMEKLLPLLAGGKPSARIEEILSSVRPFVSRNEFNQMKHEARDLSAIIVEREKHLRRELAEPEPPLLSFEDGPALITGWKAFDVPEGGRMEESSADGTSRLTITAGDRTYATYRARVRLQPGTYQFRAKAMARDVAPLPFGNRQGACIRIAGRPERSKSLTGSTKWEWLTTNFIVSSPGEEIVLLCELRASRGEALFQSDSLSINAMEDRGSTELAGSIINNEVTR